VSDNQKGDTGGAVTIRWRKHLQIDLDRLHHADSMLHRTKSDKSIDVIIIAILAISRDLQADLDQLGGLASPW
jgi:hypothetical protein